MKLFNKLEKDILNLFNNLLLTSYVLREKTYKMKKYLQKTYKSEKIYGKKAIFIV